VFPRPWELACEKAVRAWRPGCCSKYRLLPLPTTRLLTPLAAVLHAQVVQLLGLHGAERLVEMLGLLPLAFPAVAVLQQVRKLQHA
jgi:hypothetical protein